MGMEKKSGRRMGFVIAGMLLFLAAPVVLLKVTMREEQAAFGTSGCFREEEVKARAEEIVRLFCAGSYGTLLEEYGAEGTVREQNIRAMENSAAGIGADWGACREITWQALWEVKLLGGNYATVQAEAACENVTVVFRISFNEKMEMSGIEVEASAVAG